MFLIYSQLTFTAPSEIKLWSKYFFYVLIETSKSVGNNKCKVNQYGLYNQKT